MTPRGLVLSGNVLTPYSITFPHWWWPCPPVLTQSCHKNFYKNCPGPPVTNLLKINLQTVELFEEVQHSDHACFAGFSSKIFRFFTQLFSFVDIQIFSNISSWKKNGKDTWVISLTLNYLISWFSECEKMYGLFFGFFLGKNWGCSHSDLTLVQ